MNDLDDQFRSEIEQHETWLAPWAAVSLPADTLRRLKRRVRAEIGLHGHGDAEGVSGPAPLVLARAKAAVRDELSKLDRQAARRHSGERRPHARRIFRWGAGWSAVAAAVLIVVKLGVWNSLTPPAAVHQSTAFDPAGVDLFVEVLDRPASDDEQLLNTLHDDLAVAEESLSPSLADGWNDEAIDDLNDELDFLLGEARAEEDLS